MDTLNPDFEQNNSPVETTTTSDSLFPKPTGKYNVGTTSYNFVDPEREEVYTSDENDNREITAKIWYPSQDLADAEPEPYLNPELTSAVANELGVSAEDLLNFTQSLTTNSITDAPLAEDQSEYPVLVFSHGFGDLPEFNTLKAEELASQGYIVVGINHTYDSLANVLSDRETVPQSPVFDVENRSELLELLGESVDIRAEDAQFVLDELTKIDSGDDPNELFSGHLDLEKVGIYGYSLGGATAAKVLAEDHRFQAGINLDGGLVGDVANASLVQPFMFLNNQALGQGASSIPEVNQFNQLQQSFVENLQNDGYEVTILGTEHSSFNDLPFLLPLLLNSGIELGELGELINADNDSINDDFEPIAPELASQIINDYTLAFFDRYLNDEPSTLLTEDTSSIYPEVIFQAYPGTNSNSQVAVAESESNTIYATDAEILGTGDILIGGEDIDLFNDGDELLFTVAGDDQLFGGAGADVLASGAGDDLLWGGAGRDRFILSVEGTAYIQDFTPGEDLIELSPEVSAADLVITAGSGKLENSTTLTWESSPIAILASPEPSTGAPTSFI